ncbi:Pi starvation-induced protein precursor [Zea mays]|uniref:Pi starvation-induced protein n=1 Tax=Zea mays TaxID=4577 RepID=B6TGI5_MAIZE|nr:Pi starvation-induced protein precursor [Zea mays]ACG36218.1 Pi starvation-induced protein [Zea mays]AQK61738.1 Pi starvation-induced protein [Zea mays]|eukprot:NP_001149643.1 Pi starvation-induced protein precursor [Zea mays]
MKRSAASTVPLALVLIAVATTAAAADMTGASNYLVYVEPHPPGVDCQAYQLGILAAALGGEAQAKAAMLYNYRNVMSGFSARLTPPELEAVKKQPQVSRVLPSATLSLMSSKFDGVS